MPLGIFLRVFSRTKGFQTFTNRVGGALVVGGDNRRSKYRRIEAEMKNAASGPTPVRGFPIVEFVFLPFFPLCTISLHSARKDGTQTSFADRI
ncbi:hypothetical protein CEXT_417621 [Caerostris extrusa]|uniref:Uncharacterized protein n=1 Tax=Caerostris extrusa TaxID=172846 RepID=A0AAV4RBA2_CAEEX|nr:hypothetical protein CEXT_417621 [Caerostris extrusa]